MIDDVNHTIHRNLHKSIIRNYFCCALLSSHVLLYCEEVLLLVIIITICHNTHITYRLIYSICHNQAMLFSLAKCFHLFECTRLSQEYEHFLCACVCVCVCMSEHNRIYILLHSEWRAQLVAMRTRKWASNITICCYVLVSSHFM